MGVLYKGGSEVSVKVDFVRNLVEEHCQITEEVMLVKDIDENKVSEDYRMESCLSKALTTL